MKTRIINIVLIAVLSASTLSVFADDNKGKKEASQNKFSSISHLINSAKEAGMTLESWMTSLREFNSKSEIFTEEPLEMEAWMMNSFDVTNDTEDFQDEELILENWMMEEFTSANEIENFQDEELILEDWMLESFGTESREISVEEELEFEAWMLEIL